MIQDDMIVRLGQAQQQVMSLTVQNRQLRDRAEKAEHRAEVLEELIMDVVADLREGVSHAVIDLRIGRIMQRLDEDD